MPDKFIAKIPASTTNLGPGFDVFGLALKLYSTVELEELDGDRNEIVLRGLDAEKLPADEDNIALKAVELLFQRVGYRSKGVKIRLTNGIPAIRGLGGSGTAILGGLLVANEISGASLSKTELLNLAIELEGHPDNVAASLLGGFVVSVMEENSVETLKLELSPHMRVVVAIPDFTLPTKESRNVLPETIDLPTAIYNISRSSLLVGAMATGKYQLLKTAMKDRLHQPYRSKLLPGFDDVVNSALDAGAIGATLSGAGPSIAAFCMENSVKISDQMGEAFQRNGLQCDTKILEVDPIGATVKKLGD